MQKKSITSCVPVDISDRDIYEAMSEVPGYLDITPGDFKEVYRKAYEHAVRRLTRSTKVEEVMSVDVIVALTETPLAEVAELMARHKVSGVPVLNEDRTVAGIISEADFLSRMGGVESGTVMNVIADCLRGNSCLAAPIRAKTAKDIMSRPVVRVPRDALLMDVATLMTDRKINRVPVVDEADRLIGIVTRADVVRSSLVSESP